MRITIELFKGKTLKDGTNPLAIRATNCGKNKYKMLGISILEKHWNKDKKRITCRAELFREKNALIQSEYNKIVARAKWFTDNGVEYDFDYIFSDKPLESYYSLCDLQTDYNTNNFIDIIKARIDSYSKIKTKENYRAFMNVMLKFYGEQININRINQAFANAFRNKLDAANYSSNHKNSLIKCFTSCYKYGAENRWIANPFVISIKRYEHKAEERTLTFNDLTKMISCYKKEIQFNNEFKTYKALGLFMLNIALHGLAPYDLANIKIEDLKLENIEEIDVNNELLLNDEKYRIDVERRQCCRLVINIDVYRSKTGKYVPICVDYFTIRHLLYHFCKGKKREDYLIDCFSIDREYTEKQKHNRCGAYFSSNSKSLNTFLHAWEISNTITYYIARYSFINALDNMDIPHSLIRKMVGHRDNTLEKVYIYKPTKWEQSLLTYKIFNNVENISTLELIGKGEQCCNEQWQNLELFLRGEIERF